jgi:hypothetical protein
VQALILAGFRAEEYAVVRATLDSLGAHPVKVLAASDEMLYGSLDAALQEQEIDWSAPRPPEWIRGGTWGSQRTILFSGGCGAVLRWACVSRRRGRGHGDAVSRYGRLCLCAFIGGRGVQMQCFTAALQELLLRSRSFVCPHQNHPTGLASGVMERFVST